MKRLERNHKLEACNNGPVYTSMHKGIQSDCIFSRVKEHREVACSSMNEFFENIRNYYYYNFNSLLTLFGENFFCSFYMRTYEYAMLALGHVGTDVTCIEN